MTSTSKSVDKCPNCGSLLTDIALRDGTLREVRGMLSACTVQQEAYLREIDALKADIYNLQNKMNADRYDIVTLQSENAQLMFQVGSLTEQNRILGGVCENACAEVSRLEGLILAFGDGHAFAAEELIAEARSIRSRSVNVGH